MKSKKFFIINCTVLISLLLIYTMAEYILRLNNLAFRNLIHYIFLSAFAIMILLISVKISIILYNIARIKTIKLLKRIIAGFGSVLGILCIAISLVYGFVIFAFLFQPEHTVEKDGKRMVAYVNSFLHVNVNYYDYVNIFVRGKQVKISEGYGNGGYDPFEREEMPIVERYTYYDDNGKVIKSNW